MKVLKDKNGNIKLELDSEELPLILEGFNSFKYLIENIKDKVNKSSKKDKLAEELRDSKIKDFTYDMKLNGEDKQLTISLKNVYLYDKDIGYNNEVDDLFKF